MVSSGIEFLNIRGGNTVFLQYIERLVGDGNLRS